MIFIGVDDHCEIHPFPLTNRIRAQISDIAKNLDPQIEVDCIDLGEITAVIVKEGEDKPYKCADGFFMRVGATNQKLARNEILDLALRVRCIRYEAMEDLRFNYPQDFSDASFDAFIKSAHLEHVLSTMGKEEPLISMGVASRQI